MSKSEEQFIVILWELQVAAGLGPGGTVLGWRDASADVRALFTGVVRKATNCGTAVGTSGTVVATGKATVGTSGTAVVPRKPRASSGRKIFKRRLKK